MQKQSPCGVKYSLLILIVAMLAMLAVTITHADQHTPPTDGLKKWLWDQPGSVYELYQGDNVTLLLDITDCNGEHWYMIGGMLNKQAQNKWNFYEYAWMIKPRKELIDSLMNTDYQLTEHVRVFNLNVPERLCNE